jgi:uncharacterized repeat protein (TIGR01451 family)
MKKATFILFILIAAMQATAQNNLIPNTADCAGTRPPFAFTIQKAWSSSTGLKVDSRYTPLAGDIDGDGNVEVFTANGIPGNGGILYVFEGRNGTLAGQIDCPGIGTTYSSGIAIFKRNATAKGTVFIAGRNDSIYLYEVRGTTRPLQFDLVWKKRLSVTATIPVVSDLNGDGKVEIVAGQYVIDAETGNTLSTLNALSMVHQIAINQNFPVAADVDKDGHPEVIYGSDIYQFKNGFTATPTYWKRCPGMTATTNGVSIVGDINQDGDIDVVFASQSGSVCVVTVWTPLTGVTIGSFQFTIGNSISYPFIGDIDGVVTNGKKYPEICINTAGHLYAYKFDGTNFTQKWDFTHSDMSGATSLTLYDFNLDGVVELVYRDETLLHIFSDAGNTIVNATTPITCLSGTIVETPIIADVTGDGSADIIVTGLPSGSQTSSQPGELNVYEGAASKWASCPPVWNQQLYSPLYVNTDLTIPATVAPVDLTFYLPDNTAVQYYNGGPMQAPYISEDSHLPIDLSPDVYVVEGSITFLSPTSVTLTVTFGNMGLVSASASTPIRYYRNVVGTGNIIGSETLGTDLVPGQTCTISKTLTGLSPMPTQFYVRILDDGTNFPATGSYSDCNLTNNTKSFGTLELHKTANTTNSCIDGTSIFTVELINNSDQTTSPQTFNNITLTDSLGSGWQYLSSSALQGSLGTYNAATRKITWSLPSLAPGATAQMTLTAKATSAGAIRNYVWIEEVDGTTLGREVIEAYVIVNSVQAPQAASISPANPVICETVGSVTLTATASGATSYQWYRNNVEITGATQSTYTATSGGSYKVNYYNGVCVSQMSEAATVTLSPCVVPVNPHLRTRVY